jgi:hypothetical protein
MWMQPTAAFYKNPKRRQTFKNEAPKKLKISLRKDSGYFNTR